MRLLSHAQKLWVAIIAMGIFGWSILLLVNALPPAVEALHFQASDDPNALMLVKDACRPSFSNDMDADAFYTNYTPPADVCEIRLTEDWYLDIDPVMDFTICTETGAELRISFAGNELEVTGDADMNVAAQLFFQHFLKSTADAYIRKRLPQLPESIGPNFIVISTDTGDLVELEWSDGQLEIIPGPAVHGSAKIYYDHFLRDAIDRYQELIEL